MSNRKTKVLGGIVEAVTVPGAPKLPDDAHIRHLFRTVEGQRNLALSALAELKAQYELLNDTYVAHVQSLAAELTSANHGKSLLAEQLSKAKTEIAQLKNSVEPKASGNVTKGRRKSAGAMDKT